MKKSAGIALLSIAIAIVYTGCSNDKAELVYPCDPMDTVNMSYKYNIQPLIASNCYSCHAGNNPSSGYNLDTYFQLQKRAANGKLVAAITHSGGVTPMPYNQPKMSVCTINKIVAWVKAGAPNN